MRSNGWPTRYWIVIATGLALIVFSIAASLLSPTLWVDALSQWTQALGPWGVVAFALAYALMTVLLVPGSVRTIAAGMLFGLGVGALAAWSGAVLGACLAFLVGRHFARSRIEEMTDGNGKFRAIDEAICRHGWRIIGLMRLSPLIPFNISNYFYGVTKVGFWPYALASAGGMLPGTLFYAYLGAAGKAGLTEGVLQHHPVHYAFTGVGLLATIGLMVWVARLARHSLKASGAIQHGSEVQSSRATQGGLSRRQDQGTDDVETSNNACLRWIAVADASELRQAAYRRILQAAADAIDRRGRFLIVLAGGSTPRDVYRMLRTADADWARWHVYFGDERCLPVGDAERNSTMAAEAWLDHVPIPHDQVHPIPAELGSSAAAQAYAATLRDVGDFDLVLLGLGEDGHTASLFPGHDPGLTAGAPDLLAVSDAPKPPPQRVSLSAARLSRTRALLFLVAGEGKRGAVSQWRAGAAIPAQAIQPRAGVDVLVEAMLLDGRPVSSAGSSHGSSDAPG